jgi:TonB family protein
MMATSRFNAAVFAVLLFSSCIPKKSPAPAEASPLQPSTRAGTPAPSASSKLQPQAAKPLDDPATCVDPAAQPTAPEHASWQRELDLEVSRHLKEVSACSKLLAKKEDAFIKVFLLYSGSTPTAQYIMASTSSNCAVATCVKSALKAVTAPALPNRVMATVSGEVTLELRSNAPAVLASKEASDAAFPAQSREAEALCHEEIRSGRLPPELIQKTIRAHFADVRTCLERGLARNRNLEGRVVVRFVINRDGTVTNAILNGNTLPDCSVGRCVVNAFKKLAFPEPQGGIVTVVYPIMLAPG